MIRVSFVLPTYNERGNIEYMINSILHYVKGDVEIIVVDDNSEDRTWEVVEDMKNERVKLIRRIDERGIVTAIHEGIKRAQGDIVSWMDCDRSHHPKYLPQMLEELNSGYDLVIASRYTKGGKDTRPFIRRLTSYLINAYASVILGRFLDYTSGFIVMRKKVFDKVDFPEKGYGEYFIELISKCQKKGFKIREIPYTNPDRICGESKTADTLFALLRYGIQYVIKVMKIRFET